MKTSILKDTIKQITADRGYLGLYIGIIAALIVFIIYLTISIEARDIQVVTQYSAFGESHFYKARWYYLYSFIGLAVLTVIINGALMGKLLRYERRDIGLALGWLTVVFLVVAILIAHAVVQLAFL